MSQSGFKIENNQTQTVRIGEAPSWWKLQLMRFGVGFNITVEAKFRLS